MNCKIKLCPDLIGYEDIKPLTRESMWESARVPKFHPCIEEKCVAYFHGNCNKYKNSTWNYQKEGKENEWIPVEERLPEEDGLYLCSFDDGFIASVDYISGNGFMLWVDSGEVNAWMPLPEPYESKQGDN